MPSDAKIKQQAASCLLSEKVKELVRGKKLIENEGNLQVYILHPGHLNYMYGILTNVYRHTGEKERKQGQLGVVQQVMQSLFKQPRTFVG